MLSTLAIVSQLRPSYDDYRNSLLLKALDIWSVPASIRNKNSFSYINNLVRLESEKKLRYINLGLVTIIWRDDYNSDSRVYKCICPFTTADYRSMSSRIIDWGFCGRWGGLENAMLDYDIDSDQWPTAVDRAT